MIILRQRAFSDKKKSKVRKENADIVKSHKEVKGSLPKIAKITLKESSGKELTDKDNKEIYNFFDLIERANKGQKLYSEEP